MKFPECLYCKHTYIFTANWEGSPSKYTLWAAMLLPTMLPLLETFLDLLLWSSFQCSRRIFWYLQYLEIFITLSHTLFSEKSLKLLGSISGEYDGYSFSVINFWARNSLTEMVLWAGALLWWETKRWGKLQAFFYAQLQVTALVLPHNKLTLLFGLME